MVQYCEGTFTMPDVSVTIKAVFTEIPEPEPDPATGLPFVDVRMLDWYTSYVTDVYTRGLMTGIDGQHFAPGMTTSRGMIVTILHRMAGSPATEGSYFSDVPLNQYYAQAAAWAAENEIVSGYGDGRFGPDDPVTREQLVLILMRYAISKAISTDSRMDLSLFSDSGLISEEAVQAMSWACAEGLLNVEAAVARVEQVAAPANAVRLHRKTPCTVTGRCEDCHSPDRICCTTVIHRQQRVPGRIKVILVGEELGY